VEKQTKLSHKLFQGREEIKQKRRRRRAACV